MFHFFLVNWLKERYDQPKEHNEYFGFLYNLQNLKRFENQTLKKHSDDLENYLKDEDNKYISSMELLNKLISLKNLFIERNSELFKEPLTTLNFLYKNELDSTFCNLCIALRIFLTILVSIANGERSFSRLKLIKTYDFTKASCLFFTNWNWKRNLWEIRHKCHYRWIF